jgi:acetyl-CoA carboxylase carboxyltransferase component
MSKKGGDISDKEKKSIEEEIIRSYNAKSSPYYAAARLWIDEIINPVITREIISNSINYADNSVIIEDFKLGVIQT